MTAVICLVTLLGFYYAYQITRFAFIGVSNFLIFIGAVNLIILESILLLIILIYDVFKKNEDRKEKAQKKEKIERAITVEEFARAYARFGGRRPKVKKVRAVNKKSTTRKKQKVKKK